MVALGGARLEEALAMASTVPAARLGLDDRGRLEVGRRADLVLWSRTRWQIVSTVVGGAVTFARRAEGDHISRGQPFG